MALLIKILMAVLGMVLIILGAFDGHEIKIVVGAVLIIISLAIAGED